MKPKAPTGYVSNKNDCCDTDADAKPGQKGYFTKASACGNFDYDCSGSPDFQYAEGFTGCSFASVCAANGLGTPCEGDGKAGWGAVMAEPMGRQKAFSPATGVPGCGETGTFVNGCGKVKDCNGDNCACGHKDACEFDVTTGMVQPCH